MITSFTNFYCPQRSWGKVMFLNVSVILFTGGGIPACIAGGIPAYLAVGLQRGGIPACLAGFQAHTQGEVEGDLARGVSRPTPGGSPYPHPGGLSQHALRRTPLRQLPLRVVRILLECILVYFCCYI